MKFRAILILLLAGVTRCDHNEAVDPAVLTETPAQEIGKTGAKVYGDIQQTGSTRPIKYGFIWDSVSGTNIFTAKNRLDLGPTSVTLKFSISIDSLSPNTQYFARAYAASPDYSKIFYANEISFTTLP
jgi:hypothetical protein